MMQTLKDVAKLIAVIAVFLMLVALITTLAVVSMGVGEAAIATLLGGVTSQRLLGAMLAIVMWLVVVSGLLVVVIVNLREGEVLE